MGSVKLFKIASEINIGKDAIVDYLQSKGFDIQNKPTATLDEKMIDVVMEKFKKERRAAEIQREKIQKHKDIRTDVKKSVSEKEDRVQEHPEKSQSPTAKSPAKATTSPKTTDTAVPKIKADEEIAAPVEVKTPPVEKHTAPVEDKKPEPVVVETKTEVVQVTPEKPEVTKESAPIITELDGLRIVKAAPTEIKQDDKPRSESAKQSEELKKSEPKPEPVIDSQKVEPAVSEHVVKAVEPEVIVPQAKSDEEPEITNQQTEKIKKEDTKSDKKPIDAEVQEQAKVSVEKTPDKIDKESDLEENKEDDASSAQGTDKSRQDKRRDRKKKKKKAQQDTEPGESTQLKGLTVLGKIELKSAEAEKPQRGDKRHHKGEHGEGRSKFKKRKSNKVAEVTVDQAASSTGTGRTIPGLIREKDRVKMAEAAGTDAKSKFKDKEAVPAKPAKEVEREDRKKRKRKKTIREMISQEEVDRAIKETLSGMDGSAFTSQRAKIRMKKRIEREEKELKIKEEADRESKILKLSEFVTTGDLAGMMDINSADIILKCMELGLMVTINQRLDKDTISLIADDYGYEVDFLDEKEIQFIEEEEDEESSLKHRSPIVTIMGHVDHGKTSLLDYIRNANVVAGEAGGITQHIGAYNVALDAGRSITFLDTPGHEAFTAMRARGAQVTDIVILVVAADDSVMPQTIEAISHAKAANVPIVVAINKIDKPDANPDRIKQQLADHAVLVEEWGGKYQSVEISAKKGMNIDKLMEKVLIEAELLELKANPSRNCRGIVIESNMKKGWGATSTVIVQKGTLKVGDAFVSGIHSGKVRALLNERENKIELAGPSMPVLVIGFDGLPEVGDTFVATSTDAEARDIANERKQLRREQDMRKVRHMTLDQISAQIQIGGVKELNLVLKGDVSGSVEALSDSLLKLSRDEVRVSILHKGVGPITESDVMLAAASGAVVIGFNVNPTGKARKVAENEMVDIRHYDIIYDCINEIQLALEGLLTPEYKEEVTATVEIRKTFKVSRIGVIAGCFVKGGKITRNDRVRVLRDGFQEFEGTIASLKRGKDDVREVDTGFECGIQLTGFNDIHEGDIIESFKLIEVKRKFK
ncbi:MAG: translation initiation factor IF-2 [Candidatus Kapaibacterium sp.]